MSARVCVCVCAGSHMDVAFKCPLVITPVEQFAGPYVNELHFIFVPH